MSLENLETQGEMVLVRQDCSKHLRSSGVNHGTKWFVAREKRGQLVLVQHEIKRLVDFGVILLHGPLIHLRNQVLTVQPIINGRVGDPMETWSFVYGVYWELIVRVLSLLILVCS